MRLQILHLPAPADEYPFALVIDDVGSRDEAVAMRTSDTEGLAEEIGARTVLVFDEPVEVL